MAAMAPVASTSNPVAPRALPSWGSRRLARACDGRGGLHLAPFATSVPSRRASSSVTSREAIAVGDEEAGGAPRDNTSDIIAAKAAAKVAAAAATGGSDAYGASSIQVLKGLEPVRKRPGMYIGNTSTKGLHHMVWEVLDNGVDEVQAGHASFITVTVEADGSVSVEDDGRGIPTDVHPATGTSSLETVLTVLHAGGKFGGDESGYHVSGGLHGVGISVVNALSDSTEVTVWRGDREFRQEFSRGAALAPMSEAARRRKARRGRKVRGYGSSPIPHLQGEAGFRPEHHLKSDEGAGVSQLDGDVHLQARVRVDVQAQIEEEEVQGRGVDGRERRRERREKTDDGAVTIDGATYYEEVLSFPGGLRDYVADLNEGAESLHDPITFRAEVDGVQVEGALQWTKEAYTDTLLGYANSIRTSDGGTHLDGLKTSLTRAVNTQARKAKLLKEADGNLGGEHIREGLSAVIAVWVPQPEFEGQTKTRLGNPEVRRVVESVIGEQVSEHLEFYPNTLGSIFSKASQAQKAAEAAKRARELVRRKSVLRSGSLPGKLSDCSSSDPESTEIFLVEGDSAGGSAKQGRDRRFQAVLPLRGKILNVERKDDASMYKNTEITAMVTALGLGLKGDEFDESALRYSKIVILTDADVDGAHIRTLLLTFLFRYQRGLFERGKIFVAVPPLYKVESGRAGKNNKPTYCYDESQLQAHLATLPEGASKSIQRFKGLGEMMPVQLWNTTLNPETRLLKRLTVDDAAMANKTFQLLMSDKVAPRREFIETEGPKLEDIDV
jgi:DNA gyrase subunit B